VVLLAPRLPEGGGVAHHTQRLAAAWRNAGCEVTVDSSSPLRPERQAGTWADAGATALLVQYVPFLYGRFGLSRGLVRLVRLARSTGLRVTLFVHEPWVPPTRLPWLVLSPLQKRQLLTLVRLADRTVTAVPAWAPILGGDVEIIYVGSNLGDPPEATEPLDSPVLFSPFAAGLNWEWVSAAADAVGAHPGLVVLGADADAARTHPATRAWYRAEWDWRGRLPGEDVLRVVGGAPLALAPFTDGPTGRRGSLLALLSTGVRVITCDGHLADPFFVDGPIDVAHTRDEFVALALRAWESRGADAAPRVERRAWYRRHLAPQDLDARLLAVVTGRTS